ncbi:F0F1 ATP synthase subunit I [Sinirhodobacter populi]|uniref:ATP synthase protein I n=1 Tax=Paenirhodobacter populi TaxID=2306993 RepID=A0A443KC14_9RHOB|nr:AtpZ/AtpI family protein [Sinirhodobacter populi]RWR30318.1 F0F1 ATP synthase subunit I [Sinirhodobacter populi]
MPERPTERPDPERLKALEERLARTKGAAGIAPAADDRFRQADMAWRMVIEMVAGLGIGFGIGYGLDALFGTLPWLMLVFTLLGLVAGIRVMMRTAAEMNRARAAAEAAGKEGK